MEKSMRKKYEKTKHKGIWKNTKCGTYSARKTVSKKKYSKSFKSLRDAIKWRAEFNGFSSTTRHENYNKLESLNGVCQKPFKEAWSNYLDFKSKTLHDSSFQQLQNIYKRFDEQLVSMPLNKISNTTITEYLERRKLIPSNKRFSFRNELKTLKTFFNYVNNAIDFKFGNPVNQIHYQIGIVKAKSKIKKKRMVLTNNELYHFLSFLPSPIKEIAIIQFYLGARVSEVMAMNEKNLDFISGEVIIRDVAVICGKTKKIASLKETPKNGKIRIALLPKSALSILSSLGHNSDGYFFVENNKLLSYRRIQYHYNKSLKLMGIYPEVSGTHFLRHTAATIVRNKFSIEHTMAVTGHQNITMAQHYGKLQVEQKNKESVVELEKAVMSLAE